VFNEINQTLRRLEEAQKRNLHTSSQSTPNLLTLSSNTPNNSNNNLQSVNVRSSGQLSKGQESLEVRNISVSTEKSATTRESRVLLTSSMPQQQSHTILSSSWSPSNLPKHSSMGSKGYEESLHRIGMNLSLTLSKEELNYFTELFTQTCLFLLNRKKLIPMYSYTYIYTHT
jgi:hypothetical protein